MLQDKYGRPISYVRLAVTDRCNLRCTYCMPEHIQFVERKALLTFEEMERLLMILTQMGVNKVRITGGEPFMRKGLMDFLDNLSSIELLKKITLTTNGVFTQQYLSKLKALGINSINLSLDTLDAQKFFQLTRRNEFQTVWATFEQMVAMGFAVKINMVVMEDQNTEDILPMATLAEQYPVDVRFIEEMPFNGEENRHPVLKWDYVRILEELKSVYPDLKLMVAEPHSTSLNYSAPRLKGKLGVIPAYSRTFCGSCNRIRITSQGFLHTCLYSKSSLNLRSLLRSGASDQEIQLAIQQAVSGKAKNGFEAARLNKDSLSASMSTIGG
ncbi:GTP 3',8-cyclase MoaA [Limibacter armeniacum]|uniref:GTP 3',8-cyclase MoaA n=1 Tax=Limibacter armeniacum TaxID=466084 RepID=UPI002FE5DE45